MPRKVVKFKLGDQVVIRGVFKRSAELELNFPHVLLTPAVVVRLTDYAPAPIVCEFECLRFQIPVGSIFSGSVVRNGKRIQVIQ